MRDSIGYNQQVMDAVMDTKQIVQDALKNIITKNYSQYQAMPMIFNMYHDLIGYESYWPEFFNTFDEKVKNTYYGKLMKQRLTYCIGNVAPVFASTTPEGQPLSSKEIIEKSKLTIVDFWASWCAYCREEGRDFLIPLYQKYHERGLNILGVSLDDDANSWKKAISDDKYPWYQVSSLKGHDEPVGKLFEAHTPGNVLIDGEGRIVAWNISDPLELEWYINKYLLK